MNDGVIFGRGEINKLNYILSNFGIKRVLLVTGKNSYDNCSIKEKVESNLKNFTFLRYCDFDINPNAEDLIKGANLVKTYNPDAIVAIGGGSVLDTAKVISILPADVVGIIKTIRGESEVSNRGIKLILVPTTSGSGSEATHFAVAYNEKIKYSIASKYLLPDAVILDSEFTDSLSKKLTAITAFDGFSQAIESFWSLGASQSSKNYAEKSIQIILDIFEDLIIKPASYHRDMMMLASHLSGKAINISKTTAPHAISYGLTKDFNIPHGLAVMLLLPAFFKFNTNFERRNLNGSINLEEYDFRIKKLKSLMGVASSDDAIEKINNMMIYSGFKIRLRDYGINNFSDIKRLAESVNIERLNNNPIIMNQSQIISLLKTVY